ASASVKSGKRCFVFPILLTPTYALFLSIYWKRQKTSTGAFLSQASVSLNSGNLNFGMFFM
ncbi:hypothetical protein, partial [Streptococcus oralis]|uniref:hypothetical protein n=1 Tax=Streptococcus oralis TaxID=1303 RepID=UPI001E536D05